MKRIALALMMLCACSRDDGAPSAADQRELDAAEAMLNEAPDAAPDGGNAAQPNP